MLMYNFDVEGIERRASRRFPVNIDLDWEGKIGRQKGTVSDISMLGCFVLCSGEVDDGETVKLFLPIDGSMKVQFDALVMNHVFEIGFGAKFVAMNDARTQLLKKVIDQIGGANASRI